MHALLTALRQHTPQPTPVQFLAQHPGCFIQYYDDTPARDPAKAISAAAFDPAVARRKQRGRCAVCFSLQAFRGARTQDRLCSYSNLGVDVDLALTSRPVTVAEADGLKEEYLRGRLVPFPLQPHWLTETQHGFHVIFRVRPLQDVAGIRAAHALARRLIRALGGDPNAALLTQVLRVPGTYQFKDPARPFLCRQLMDNAGTVAPYDLDTVRSVLDAWEVFHGGNRGEAAVIDHGRSGKPGWRNGLAGVPVGNRNGTAASVVGAILARLPEDLWDLAGWGGLKEWNARNPAPLPERELRSVFLGIARRERAARQLRGVGRLPPTAA